MPGTVLGGCTKLDLRIKHLFHRENNSGWLVAGTSVRVIPLVFFESHNVPNDCTRSVRPVLTGGLRW